METEVHVYAFSIAANVLLSFYPFLIVMVSICRYILNWEDAAQAIYLALNDYFPGEVGHFVTRNLDITVRQRGPLQWGSIVLLFFTPMEFSSLSKLRSIVPGELLKTGAF
ncbi:MAG: hypothetical protein WKF37_06990 [Bryobacteraceae bacterium]